MIELGEKPTMTYVHADIPGHEALEKAITNLANMTGYTDELIEFYCEKKEGLSDAKHG